MILSNKILAPFLMSLIVLVSFSSMVHATDLELSKVATEADILPGENFGYSLTIRVMDQDAQNVKFADNLPVGMDFSPSNSVNQDTCSIEDGPDNTSDTISCEFGDLPVGTTMVLEILVTYVGLDPVGTVITNSANVTAENESDTSNNSASADVTVVAMKAEDGVPMNADEEGGCSLSPIGTGWENAGAYLLWVILLGAGLIRRISQQ